MQRFEGIVILVIISSYGSISIFTSSTETITKASIILTIILVHFYLLHNLRSWQYCKATVEAVAEESQTSLAIFRQATPAELRAAMTEEQTSLTASVHVLGAFTFLESSANKTMVFLQASQDPAKVCRGVYT